MFLALNASKHNLQSKLANMRDQNRSMDATIDNYRKQLDEAKQLLQQKDTQVWPRLFDLCTGTRLPEL